MKEANAAPAVTIDIGALRFRDAVESFWPGGLLDTVGHPGIGFARTRQDFLALGRHRYELFAAHGVGIQARMDHANRLFLEPVDQLSLNFMARFKGRIVAAVRATWANDAILDPSLEQVLAHADLGAEELERSIIHSRLAVERTLSARSLIPALFRAMFHCAQATDVRFCLAAAPPRLTPLLERFGFRLLERRRPYFDETGGWMSVLLLDLDDRRRLVETRSPLLAACDMRMPKRR
jgi:hypothetical protein